MDRHALYGLPLERFTEARNALAKRLRQDGLRDEAAEVLKLKKPSIAAWAVNQLVRTQKREVDALFKAGNALQKAQANVLAGKGDAGSLRKAAEAERAALDELTQRARGLLSSEGHELTQAKLEQVSETLHAAAIDEDARTLVEDGCLVRELRHAGLGTLGAGGRAKARASRAHSRAGERQRKPEPGALRSARQAEAAAGRALERALRTVKAVEDRRDRAEGRLREADDALRAARDLADDAARSHKQARQALEEL